MHGTHQMPRLHLAPHPTRAAVPYPRCRQPRDRRGPVARHRPLPGRVTGGRQHWLAAFGLTLSLVWIYLEMLRFLSRFYSRD
jgi:hypothetical protein